MVHVLLINPIFRTDVLNPGGSSYAFDPDSAAGLSLLAPSTRM
jgi:hypothetical protein